MKDNLEKFIDKGSVAYTGKITVSILKGRTVLKTIKTHNKGYKTLFNFLCQCLAGEYDRAESLRPRFIRLFTMGSKGSAYSEEHIPQRLQSQYLTSLTVPSYNTTPSVDLVEIHGQEPYAKTIFKFLIPFTQIETTRDTNMFALYSSANQSNLTEPSAVFVLMDPDDETKLGSVMSSSSSAKSNDYNLQIQWELTIENAQ